MLLFYCYWVPRQRSLEQIFLLKDTELDDSLRVGDYIDVEAHIFAERS